MKTIEKSKVFNKKDYQYYYKKNFERNFEGGFLDFKRTYYNEDDDKFEDVKTKNNEIISYYTVFFDAELDPYEVDVSCDGIEINTDNYTHIVLGTLELELLDFLWQEFKDESQFDDL